MLVSLKAFFAYTLLYTVCCIDGLRSCNAKSSALPISVQSSGSDFYDGNMCIVNKKRRLQLLYMNSNPEVLPNGDTNKASKMKSKIEIMAVQCTAGISNVIMSQLIKQKENFSSLTSSSFFSAGKTTYVAFVYLRLCV